MMRKAFEYIIMGVATLGAIMVCFWFYMMVCLNIDMGGGGNSSSTPCDIIFSNPEPTNADFLRAMAEPPKPVSASFF